jgi:enoyl-CoA hydratase/carnithine racemase
VSSDLRTGRAGLVARQSGDDGVTHIRLTRPEKLNAINPIMMRELRDAFDDFHGDPHAKVAVLSGEGRAFCAGADVAEAWCADRPTDPAGDLTRLPDLFWPTGGVKPVVAAVHGHVIGAGLRLALLSDFVVCGQSASFRVPELGHGLDGGPYWAHLRARAGDAFAMDVVATGRPWSAAEAADRGLVVEVVPDADVPAAAIALAGRVAAQPTPPLLALVDARRAAMRRVEFDAWVTRHREGLTDDG